LPQFALTRTVPPIVGKLAVDRSRLLADLDRAASRKLIIIKAPAGYGKTTLAASWCNGLRESQAIIAWLSLDVDDNEPGTFAYHLARTIERASEILGRGALELLEASSLIPPQNVISALVNSASEIESDIFVLLDDYHVVNDHRCHELIDFLLRHAPSNLHLVMLTRMEPRLPLSRLRLEEAVAEIDASLLHFDLSETRQFLGSDLCDSLQAKGVAKLYAATEGWPAALQLARISLRSSSDPAAHVRKLSGTTRTISEYLGDTLQSMPEEIVDFLLRTSILDQMNGPLCEAVTGVSQSGLLLTRLERQQFLVIPLDEVGDWYRYHHLMREFLTHRLEATMSDQVAKLHRAAYAWYAAEELWTQAVHHAIAASDYDRAFEFVSQCAMSLVVRGDLLTLLAWERQLPGELMSGQLEVKLALAWGMALVTRFKEADGLLLQVERAADASPRNDLWWRCRAARSIYYALLDDSARGRDLASECLDGHDFDPFNFNALCNVTRYDHMKAGDWNAFQAVDKPKLSDGEASYVLPENYRLCLCGMAEAQQLNCEEALKLYANARSLAEKYVGPKSIAATMVTGLAARIHYERGDVLTAEVSVLDALDLIETTAFHEGFLQAFLVIVRAAGARNDSQRALGLLNRAERLCWERDWGRVAAALLAERARLLLQERKLHEALPLLQAFDDLKTRYKARRLCSWTEIATYQTATNGLVAGATGHWDDAVSILQDAYDTLLSGQNQLDALRVGTDLAVALSRTGACARGFVILKDVLQRAARENLTTFILERKDDIGGLLSSAKELDVFGQDGRLQSFATDLSARLRNRDARQSGLTAEARTGQALTERELSIVSYIAVGHSNKEIARELGVAPETIKTHVKRIFHKLSAETRAQAVVRAQSLGMLGSARPPLGTRTFETFNPGSKLN
jgi:LuxR family maltose regulon positive regulatory protein